MPDQSSRREFLRKLATGLPALAAGAALTQVGVTATYFGDKNDPESLVSELSASPRVMRLKEEQGTNPKVYYLVRRFAMRLDVKRIAFWPTF